MPKKKVGYQSVFQNNWLEDDAFKSWLRAAPGDPYSAQCILCNNKKFAVGSMGRTALTSHMNGKHHTEAAKNRDQTVSIETLLRVRHTSSLSSTSTQSATPLPQPAASSQPPISSLASASEVSRMEPSGGTPLHAASTSVMARESGSSSRGLSKFILNEDVTKAEVIWAINTVMRHSSVRAAADTAALFPLMFPDSDVAKKLQIQRTKLSYLIVYGVAPYFEGELLKTCNDASHLVLGFDESLNKISQKGQMDLTVRFWDELKNEVTTRYLTSTFLGHSTSADLLCAFTSAAGNAFLKKLLQVSMDGPNVNHKFLRELKKTSQH